VDTFSKFFTNHRHRRAIPGSGDSRYMRKHQNIVPDYVKKDPTKNPKIELIRNKHGKQICDNNTLVYIKNEYNVIPFKGEVKKLGSTGIKLYFDDKLKKFVIER